MTPVGLFQTGMCTSSGETDKSVQHPRKHALFLSFSCPLLIYFRLIVCILLRQWLDNGLLATNHVAACEAHFPRLYGYKLRIKAGRWGSWGSTLEARFLIEPTRSTLLHVCRKSLGFSPMAVATIPDRNDELQSDSFRYMVSFLLQPLSSHRVVAPTPSLTRIAATLTLRKRSGLLRRGSVRFLTLPMQ